VSRDTSNILLLNEIYQVCRLSGNFQGAVKAGKKLILLAPENDYFRLQLANLYLTDKKFKEAKYLLIPLQNKDTTNFYVVKQLGICYDELNNFDSARYYYQKALTIAPFDPPVTNRIINLLLRKEKFEDALRISFSFLSHDSTYLPVVRQKAYCYYLMNVFETAIIDFSKCIAAGDTSLFVMKYTALSFYKQGKYDSAAPYFRKAFYADTTDSFLCYYYGVSEFRGFLGLHIDTAIMYLNRAARMIQPSPKFLSLISKELGAAFSEKGDGAKAAEYYKQAYESTPEENNLLFLIAYQYDYYLNNNEEAIKYYEAFLQSNPNEFSAFIPKEKATGGDDVHSIEMVISYAKYAKDRLAALKK
jgi:tetratricopeptide (TPR) repeat protein